MQSINFEYLRKHTDWLPLADLAGFAESYVPLNRNEFKSMPSEIFFSRIKSTMILAWELARGSLLKSLRPHCHSSAW
jgi:hypothetical protein